MPKKIIVKTRQADGTDVVREVVLDRPTTLKEAEETE